MIPVFPLNTVLFPDGVLPLRIFEARYLAMVSRCMREEIPFVVCLIDEGSEVGRASFRRIGTTARIVDWDQGDDGLLHLRCVGEDRVRLLRTEVQPDGLNLAEVERIDTAGAVRVPEQFGHVVELFSRLVPPGAEWAAEDAQADAGWLADRLAEAQPLAPGQRQQVLEVVDRVERLALISGWIPALD